MGAVGAALRQGKVARFQLKSTPTQKSTLLAMADDAKLEEIQKLGGTAIKPVGWDRTGWEAFQYMLWNPDTGEILTRTPLSWLKITVFYCIYYCFLAGFWIACLNVFFATLPEAHDGPRWLKEDSIIGVNPGVGLRPRNTDSQISRRTLRARARMPKIMSISTAGVGMLPTRKPWRVVLNTSHQTRASPSPTSPIRARALGQEETSMHPS